MYRAVHYVSNTIVNCVSLGAILNILMGDIAIFGQDLAEKEEMDVRQRLSLAENKFIDSGTSFV